MSLFERPSFSGCTYNIILPWSLTTVTLALCSNGARRVICIRTANNFFWEPPSPWVHFFGCRRRPTARRRSSYRPSSSPIVSTSAFSLDCSWCAISFGISDEVGSFLSSHVFVISRQTVVSFRKAFILASIFPDGRPSWLQSFLPWYPFRPAGVPVFIPPP
jgi:hypothetical protein